MKQSIVDINSIKDAIPQYKTWYRYYDDILISVICNGNRASYIRRKAKSSGSKNDSELCFWHSNWQYSEIESRYGLSVTGKRTYEIVEEFEGEIHRIDSVVSKIAIEFQHSLGVSLGEMDSRYNAHNALGYLPYLVLDFTDISSDYLIRKGESLRKDIDDQIHRNRGNDDIIRLLKRIKKWMYCSYFAQGNLFLDFSDQIIRFSSRLNSGFQCIRKSFFIENICNLETILNDELEKEATERIAIVLEKEAKETKKKENAKARYIEKLLENKKAILNGKDFIYYRSCLKNKLIAEGINNLLDIEYIKYTSYSRIKDNILRKYHVYHIYNERFSPPIIELQYITNGCIENNKYNYHYTDITLIRKYTPSFNNRGIKRFTFRQYPGKNILISSKRIEYVQGVLHSTSEPALERDDENGKFVSNHYYLFNIETDKPDWEILSFYYDMGSFIEDEEKEKVRGIIDKISDTDKYDFSMYYYQNDLPSEVLNNYYSDIDEKQPLTEIFL